MPLPDETRDAAIPHEAPPPAWAVVLNKLRDREGGPPASDVTLTPDEAHTFVKHYLHTSSLLDATEVALRERNARLDRIERIARGEVATRAASTTTTPRPRPLRGSTATSKEAGTMPDTALAYCETVDVSLSVIANCKGSYAGRAGCENCQERMRLIVERERVLREALAKIAGHATSATGVPDRDKLIGIAQEARRGLA